jgi:uncharacterized protein (TIGR03437 family)
MVQAADATASTNFGTRQFVLSITPLNITNGFTLPFGNIGTLYSQTLNVTGAVGAVGFSLTPNSFLPPGLTLNALTGTIGGTPTATGQFPFGVTVSDTAGNTLTRFFTLFIFPQGGAPPVVPPSMTGVFDAATFLSTGSPGGMMTILGSNLSASLSCFVPTGVATTTCNTTSVLINGFAVPLLFASAGQVNFILPFSITGATVTVQVGNQGLLSQVVILPVVPVSPGLFNSGIGNGLVFVGLQITAANPAHPGDLIQVYANGLGTTNPAIDAGTIGQFTRANALVTVTVGGVPATVSYAGLMPGQVGYYEVDFTVPQGASGNPAVVLTANGISSNGITLPVAPSSLSSALVCGTNVSSAPQLRAEGFTEQIGDITVTCTGGFAPVVGAQIPTVNISVFLNTAVTSRLLPVNAIPNTSEALLMIDEPGAIFLPPVAPGFGSQAPQRVCGVAGTFFGSGTAQAGGPATGCTEFATNVNGVTVATDTPNGTTPGANVFQGIVNPDGSSPNLVTFFGVPVLPPGTSGAARVLRITNIRINATALSGLLDPSVVASIVVGNPTVLPITNPTPTVGFVQPGLTTSVSGAANLSQCQSATNVSVSTLTFTETFATAFKTRVAAQANTLYAGQGIPGAIFPGNQNIPGSIYNSESDFVLPADVTQTAGLTDFGTRLRATFNNVPAGVHLFVSVGNVTSNLIPVTPPAIPGGSTGNTALNPYAQLVLNETIPDGNAAGFPGVSAGPNTGSVPTVEIPVVNGSATAVWEVVNTNPAALETLKFAVYATFAANVAQNLPALGAATVNLSFAPAPPAFTAIGGAAASSLLSVPRFIADPNAAGSLFTISPCPPLLAVTKTHIGNFTQGQNGAAYTVTVSNAALSGPTNAPVTVTETMPSGLTLVSMAGSGWSCQTNNCSRTDILAGGASYPAITVTVNVGAGATSPLVNSVNVSGGGSVTASAADSTTIVAGCSYSLSSPGTSVSFNSGTGSLSVTPSAGCSWNAVSNTSWLTVTAGATGSGIGTVGYSFAANPNGTPRSGTLTIAGQTFTVTQAGVTVAGPQALRFVPVTPCRIADTRNPTGPLGGPAINANSSRDFNIPASPCGIPFNAQAYSLNLTVVPLGPLGFLQVFPAGQGQPSVSTLNSGDGRVKANAAIVPAGVNGAVTLFASDPTHVIVDINGYFVPASGAQNLAFYPIAPCRLADTRGATGTFGGPVLAASTSRNFPVLTGPCGIPATAQAYAFNMTVVPTGPLGFLSAWPAGGQPGSSTLNAPTGTVTANMAIIPAGTGGAISVVATNATDLIIDITGYFAPPGAPGSLDFYTATPCRILDTRGAAGAFGGPMIGAGQSRSFLVPSSGCGIPATAKAYSLNATVVPPTPLGFLTLWGSGGNPGVSTLNASDGSVVANAALMPAGTNGAVTAFTSSPSHLILDINGYFQ